MKLKELPILKDLKSRKVKEGSSITIRYSKTRKKL